VSVRGFVMPVVVGLVLVAVTGSTYRISNSCSSKRKAHNVGLADRRAGKVSRNSSTRPSGCVCASWYCAASSTDGGQGVGDAARGAGIGRHGGWTPSPPSPSPPRARGPPDHRQLAAPTDHMPCHPCTIFLLFPLLLT
jgi:hypothetical protein